MSWKTRKQDVVASSSTEAEYVALSEATREAIWLRRILGEIETRNVTRAFPNLVLEHEQGTEEQWEHFGGKRKREAPGTGPGNSKPQIIYADNQGAIKLAENPQSHNRTKHIDIRYHFVRLAKHEGIIDIQYISTNDMTADILTKALPRDRHLLHMVGMGLCSFNYVSVD
jgi:hypothetical protein